MHLIDDILKPYAELESSIQQLMTQLFNETAACAPPAAAVQTSARKPQEGPFFRYIKLNKIGRRAL